MCQAAFFLLDNPISPSKPDPNNHAAAGMGISAGGFCPKRMLSIPMLSWILLVILLKSISMTSCCALNGVAKSNSVWRGPDVRFEEVADDEAADVLDIPKSATGLKASREEFFRVVENSKVYAE